MLVITNPTPMAVANEIYPRVYAWAERLEDLSGIDVDDAAPSSLIDLLREIGRVYIPFLLANNDAVKSMKRFFDRFRGGY